MVTNRRGAPIVPEGVYDEYIQRGESENRNKELKIDLCGGRLSDHRFMANLFRLLMHTAALNLLIRLRRVLPDAPPRERRSAPLPDAERVGPPTAAELRHAQPATWRLRIIAFKDHPGGRGSDRQLPPRAGAVEQRLAQPADLADRVARGPALLTPHRPSPRPVAATR